MIDLLERNNRPVQPIDREFVAKIDEILESRQHGGRPRELLERRWKLQGQEIPKVLGEITDLEQRRKARTRPTLPATVGRERPNDDGRIKQAASATRC